jgi:hypothetical protein
MRRRNSGRVPTHLSGRERERESKLTRGWGNFFPVQEDIMVGWFPGVQRFVLISRLAVCSVGGRLHTAAFESANNTIATRHARTHGGVRESEQTPRQTPHSISTNTTCKITHSRDCRSRNANLRARLRHICGLAPFAPVRSLAHHAFASAHAIVCSYSLCAMGLPIALPLTAFSSYIKRLLRT